LTQRALLILVEFAREVQLAGVFSHHALMNSTDFLSDVALSSAVHDMLATNVSVKPAA
jgi:hypothetical protein